MEQAKTTPRWWDFPSALLILVVLETVATRLAITHWTSHLYVTQTLVFFGVIAGLALGQSRFSPRVVGALAVAYGLFLILWQTGVILEVDLLWLERLAIIANRLIEIFTQWFGGQKVQDSLLFLLSMYFLFWFLAAHAGYTLARYGQSWQALLPGGLALVVIDHYDRFIERHTWLLAAFVFLALALVGRVTFVHRSRHWKETHTSLAPHVGLEFVRLTLITALLIVLFSWSTPALAEASPAAQRMFRPVTRAWEHFRDQVDEALAPLRSAVGIVNNSYGPSAQLGLGSELPMTQMFIAKAPAETPNNLRFYWRARTYDTYSEGQWYSTINKREDYHARPDELKSLPEKGRWIGSFEIINTVPFSTFFAPSQPVWVSRPGQVEFAENPDGTVDLSLFRAMPALKAGQTYIARGAISSATIAELRAAGTAYPAWVTQRYLKLPGSITDRTRALALGITAGMRTPYDQAQAITEWLRQNMTYTMVIEEEPLFNRETIDWFLFDLKKGFCNYYSTAEVVLLRALGVPARWSVGYAEGEYAEGGTYTVRAKDAHAWPEVYFPGIGWVEFEPTASQPEIARLPGEDTEPTSDASLEGTVRRNQEQEDSEQQPQGDREAQAAGQLKKVNMVYWILAILIMGSALVLIWYYARHKTLPAIWIFGTQITLQNTPILLEKILKRTGIRPPQTLQLWARRAELPPLTKAYMEINRALNRIQKPPAPNDTPAERARNLGAALPPTQQPAQRLVTEYQLETFSNQKANLNTAIQAASEIHNFSIRALTQRWLSRFQQPRVTTRRDW